MTSYLLLRNNKESGPYTLNELVSQRLKAYDLVWANGKSAAWRYPGEIPELKEYAPAVEEQPYDRFFKKPSEQKKQETVVAPQQKTIEPSEATPAPVIRESIPIVEEVKPSFVPKRSVFVTLPGQKQQQAVVKEEAPVKKYEQYQPRVNERVYEAEEPAPLTKTITITENPVAAEIKYSQPLDEIKEMYVKTLQDRKQKIAYKTFLLQSVKKIAVVLVIVGAGVLIGFTIKSNSGKKEIVADASITKKPVISSTEGNLPDKPAETVTQQTDEATNEQPQQQRQVKTQQAITAHEPAIKTPATEKAIKESSSLLAVTPRKENTPSQHREVAINEPSPGVEVNESTGERTRKMRSAENETALPVNEKPKAVFKNGSLSKLVSVNSNEYQRVAFGGIRNLQLTVNNDSKYILDNVVVELQYLKPSEEPLRTENISFKSISPGGSSTIRLPDTNRGIKVLYKITNILSIQAAKDMADM
ncbi:MAG TPA: hypothetical protein VF487_04735 [Chitinophagaceae bacterium]